MTVSRLPSGKWAVLDSTGAVISEHETNAQAWRALDRMQNEPINKREDTADWVWRRGLDQ